MAKRKAKKKEELNKEDPDLDGSEELDDLEDNEALLEEEELDEDELDEDLEEEEEFEDEDDDDDLDDKPSSKPSQVPRNSLFLKIGAGLIVLGLVALVFIPIWMFAIVPPMKVLPDDEETYDTETEYEGELKMLDTATYQLVTYPNARGVKYAQLNSSDDTYLDLYANLTVYDSSGNLITILVHSEKTMNRESYEETLNDNIFNLPIEDLALMIPGTVGGDLNTKFAAEGYTLAGGATLSNYATNTWQIKDGDDIYLIENYGIHLKVFGEASDRPYWFPIGTEKKEYKFANVFEDWYQNTYIFAGEEDKSGLTCYKFTTQSTDVPKGVLGDFPLLMDYKETVWIYPATGSTIDQEYEVLIRLVIPDNIADLPDDYESSTGYTGTYSVLDPVTFQMTSLDAKGVLFVEAVDADGMELDLEGNLSLYNMVTDEFIEELASVDMTINRRSHNTMVNGTEVDIDYTADSFTAPNPMVPGYWNTYTLKGTKVIGMITTNHFLSEEKDIPVPPEIPGTTASLDFTENIWVDPLTGVTLDQTYDITGYLIFPEDMADLPTDYVSYTNYTGDYTELDMLTFQPKTIDATGTLDLKAVSATGNNITLKGNLTLYNETGALIDVLAQLTQEVNKHTKNAIVGGAEVVITYNESGYKSLNPMVPGYLNDYVYVDTKDFSGITAFHYVAVENLIPYDSELPEGVALPEGTHLFLNYRENIWVDPISKITLDQVFNITALLMFPEDMADIRSDYESYVNYTGDYTTLNFTTFQPNTIAAKGVMYLEAVNIDGMEANLMGNLTLLNAADDSFIKVMADINQTVHVRTHNKIVNDTEVVITYNMTGYDAENLLIPGYMNSYSWVENETVMGVPTYHYRAEELMIPYDIGLPAGIALPPGTHLFLDYVENVWIDPVTKTTLNQSLNVTAMLYFPTDMLDIPEDHHSYTNYTGDFGILDAGTMVFNQFNNVTGAMEATSLGYLNETAYPEVLSINTNLTVFAENGTPLYTLVHDVARLVNKKTGNPVNETGVELMDIAYKQENFTMENALVSGHLSTYVYLGVEQKSGVDCYVYEVNETIPYDEGLPAGVVAGSTMFLDYYEKIWVDPVTEFKLDQEYNVTSWLQLPNLNAWPQPHMYDPLDSMFDEEAVDTLYIFDGGTDVVSQPSGYGLNATFLGYDAMGYLYNATYFFADGTSETYFITVNPYTSEIMNYDFGGSKALFTFPVGMPNMGMEYPMWDPDMNVSVNASYVATTTYYGQTCHVYEYKIDNMTYDTDRKFGAALGQMKYNTTVRYYIDAASGLTLDVNRTVQKFATGPFDVSGVPLTNTEQFFHIQFNFTQEVIDGRIAGVMPSLREAVFMSEANVTAMTLVAELDDATIAQTLMLRESKLLGLLLAGMGFQAPAEVINAAWDDATVMGAAKTVGDKQMAVMLGGMGYEAPAKIINAAYDTPTQMAALATAAELQKASGIAAQGYKIPAKLITASYDNDTKIAAISTVMQLMVINNLKNDPTALSIEATYTEDQGEVAAEDAKELESKLFNIDVLIPLIVAIVGFVMLIAGAALVYMSKKGEPIVDEELEDEDDEEEDEEELDDEDEDEEDEVEDDEDEDELDEEDVDEDEEDRIV